MTLLHPCSECGTLYEFAETQVSSTVQCSQCGSYFRVQNRFLNFLLQSRKQAIIAPSQFHAAIDLDTKGKVLLHFPPKPVLEDPDYRAWLDAQAVDFGEFEHPHAARYLGMAQAREEACLVWEDASTTTLAARIKAERRLSETVVLRFALEIASVLQAANEREYFHGAISASHILFDNLGNAMLAGLGFPFPITADTAKQEGIYYLAPECLEDIGDWRSDIYGLGACMFHALTGYPPMAASPDTHLDIIVRLKRTAIPIPLLNPPISEITAQVLRRMLNVNADLRLSSYPELIELLQAAQTKVSAQPVPAVRAVAAVAKGPKRSASISGMLSDSIKRLFDSKKIK